jgi:two-component system, OmpR family, response regulator QseB
MSYSFAIVDDDRLLRELIERELETSFECRITEFEDGEQALDHIPGENFDLVIVDDRMPKIDGHKMVQALRSRGLAVPVIMLSNAPESEDRGRAAGISDFLYKADLDRLPELVRKWV